VSKILVGKGEQPVYLLAKYGNRHGQAGGAHSRKPDRPADPAGRAGRYPRRIASL